MTTNEGSLILGIDIGGTFTDVIALDTRTGRVASAKASTTPGRLVDGLIDSIQALGLDLGQATKIIHGSTTCTNALIERKEARTGFIGTRGFSDEFDIQRMIRRWGRTSWSSIYDLQQTKPKPFVARRLRREVNERIIFPGTVLQPLDPAELSSRAEELVEAGVEAIAICFLWSTLRPEHEREARRVIREEFPDLPVSISSDVAPVTREYERMVTTAVNASLMPVMTGYLASLEAELQSRGFAGDLFLMQSHGGIARPKVLAERPILTLRGGPVAGVVAANYLGRRLQRKKLLSCDIGGTSCDTAVILDHRIPVVEETEVDFYPVKVPTADIRCIGAGAGSIGEVDPGGALRVGPESAGSIPGPACYGLGGEQPTLTDANLLLGRLREDQLCGRKIRLHLEKARQSMQKIAAPLKWVDHRAAQAMITIAVANMADSIRLQTVDRGHDPREFSLMVFGGAGPLHATLLAEACSIPEVIIPIQPGVFSTLGMVVAELGCYSQCSFLKPLAKVIPEELNRHFQNLERNGAEVLSGGVQPPARIAHSRSAAMRYLMQEWEIRVPVPGGPVGAEALKEVRRDFHRVHQSRYGFCRPDQPVEFVTLFVDSFLPPPVFDYEEPAAGAEDPGEALSETRSVFVDDRVKFAPIPVYERQLLKKDNLLEGPCLIEEPTSTTFIHAAWRGRVDGMGNLVLSPMA